MSRELYIARSLILNFLYFLYFHYFLLSPHRPCSLFLRWFGSERAGRRPFPD